MSAHGTGAGIPPVDEQVVGLTVVTPGRGTLHLSLEVGPSITCLKAMHLCMLGSALALMCCCSDGVGHVHGCCRLPAWQHLPC